MNIKEYFQKDLAWGNGYQSHVVFSVLMDAATFCAQGVILDTGVGHQRYKPFFEQSLYLTQEHEAGIELKQMGSISYDFISPLDKKIPLEDNCLDGVLVTSVLEHV